MPSLFSKPPSPPPPPKMAPPTQTPLMAELQQLSKRQGQNAAAVGAQGGKRGTTLTHSLTG